MNFDQVRYFVSVAKLGHMGRAARKLGISQSALSHSLAKFEEWLGAPLFERVGRGIQLNDEGRLLLEHAIPLLERANDLEHAIRSRQGKLYGYLRLAAPVGLAAAFVGPAWAKLRAANPKIQAELRSLRSVEVVSRVISSEVDLGFCFGPQSHPFFESRALATRRLLMAVRQNHPVLKCRKLPELMQGLSSLSSALPLGLLGFGTNENHPFFDRLKLRPSVDFLYDNYQVAIHYIRSNGGWCLLPDWVVTENSRSIAAVDPDRIFEPLDITAIWLKARPLSIVGGLLLKEVEAYLNMT